MSATILTLIALIVVLVCLAIWANSESYEGWTIVFIVSAIVTGIFGLGMFGTLNTNRTEIVNTKLYEVLKGRHIVVACTNQGNTIFTNYDVEQINDSTQFYWLVKYNHYNVEMGRDLKYK